MIQIIYHQSETEDAYGDEDEYIGQNNVKEEINIKEFKTHLEAETFISDLSVSAGESEGHKHYKILAVFDKENSWYDERYAK